MIDSESIILLTILLNISNSIIIYTIKMILKYSYNFRTIQRLECLSIFKYRMSHIRDILIIGHSSETTSFTYDSQYIEFNILLYIRFLFILAIHIIILTFFLISSHFKQKIRCRYNISIDRMTKRIIRSKTKFHKIFIYSL